MPVSRGSELPTTSFSKLEPLSSDNPLSALKIQPWRSKVSLATLVLMIFAILLAGCYLGSKVYCLGSIYCLRRSAEALDTNHLIGSNTSKSYDTSRTSLYSNPTNNDKVIIYAYYETPAARINFEFFLKHALHAHADFIIILNGRTNIDETIPRASNIRIVRKENTCYDLGSYGIVLNENEREVVNRYRWFVMMNASIRGPFIPHWSDACWSDSYISKVTDRVKLVGMSFNCEPTRHVQSMIWATDRIGIDLLLSPSLLSSCPQTMDEAVLIETSATATILAASYTVDTMLLAYQADPTFSTTCSSGDLLLEGEYFGTSVSPWEMIFTKSDEERISAGKGVLEKMTEWTEETGYSSFGPCERSARISGLLKGV